MALNLNQLLQERTGLELGDLAGTRLTGEIPISDALVNTLVARKLAGHAQIASLHVQAQPNDTVAIQVVPRAWLIPSVTITATIERQPAFPANPTLLLRWSMPAVGPLTLLAAPLLAYFKAMPTGIRLDGDRLAIDLRELLHARGLDDVIGLMKTVEVHTRPGGFVVRLEAAT